MSDDPERESQRRRKSERAKDGDLAALLGTDLRGHHEQDPVHGDRQHLDGERGDDRHGNQEEATDPVSLEDAPRIAEREHQRGQRDATRMATDEFHRARSEPAPPHHRDHGESSPWFGYHASHARPPRSPRMHLAPRANRPATKTPRPDCLAFVSRPMRLRCVRRAAWPDATGRRTSTGHCDDGRSSPFLRAFVPSRVDHQCAPPPPVLAGGRAGCCRSPRCS